MSEDEAFTRFILWCARDGQESVANACGLSAPMISQIKKGHKKLSPKVAAAMGLRRVVTFEPIA